MNTKEYEIDLEEDFEDAANFNHYMNTTGWVEHLKDKLKDKKANLKVQITHLKFLSLEIKEIRNQIKEMKNEQQKR
jgi:hypothetical protein